MPEDRRIRWNGWGAQDEALPESLWRWLAGAVGMPALLATPPRSLSDITLPEPRLAGDAAKAFVALLGAGRVRQDDMARAAHAGGRGIADLLRLRAGDMARCPDAVLYPRSEAEVLAVMQLCAQHDVAVVPYGGGGSLVGGVTPDRQAHAAIVTLDLTGLDRILSVDTMSGLAQIEAGITGPELERQLGVRGMTLGHRPDNFEVSTLGGWIAHAGSGQEAARYGNARDWLAGLRLATPEGLLDTGDAPASATGPDIKQVVLGSEGIFGVITSATVRVRAVPVREDWRGYFFPDFASGLAAIREAQRQGIAHSMLRLSDDGETGVQRAFDRAGRRRDIASLWLDFRLHLRDFDHKAAAMIAGFNSEAARHRFDGLARRLGALALGETPGLRWRDRRYHAPCLRDALLDRGMGLDSIETAASWSKLPALYAGLRRTLNRAMRDHAPREGAQGLVLMHTGAAYPDGASLNVSWMYPRNLKDEIAQALAIRRAALDAVRAHGGTISHGHGVGEDYLPWMEVEKGALGLEALRGIKRSLDPRGILNPGKLIA